MNGWTGYMLKVDLTRRKAIIDKYDDLLKIMFIGGRGFAAKVLWDHLPVGVDPLSSGNKLVIAGGPLTGLPIPSSGKIVLASKSPLTYGYGDGSIGGLAAVYMRRGGYDMVVVEGRAEKLSILVIDNSKVEVQIREDLRGLSTSETESELKEEYGRSIGVLSIGVAGENLVRYANVISQSGRAGGRTGIGAVMGSKNLKAVVFMGEGDIPVANFKNLEKLACESYHTIVKLSNYSFWIRQGTMSTIEWSQENAVLPCMNFREGVFEYAEDIGGYAMEGMRVGRRGCPYCNAKCGNIVEDSYGFQSELDYENVAMLGANIGLGDLRKVAALTRFADEAGVDTISLGNVIGFAFEASEKRLIDEQYEWGVFDDALTLAEDIVNRRGVGDLLADGVRIASSKIPGSEEWAMHVKGLEISGYDCHSAPGMALAYGTSPIGAHHKDAWIISWEVKNDRLGYTNAKVSKLIELQRIRGGIFESLTVCRLPWVELGFELRWYKDFFESATGLRLSLDDFFEVADRIYTLIRAFWVREMGGWSPMLDYPPARWFKEPTTRGPFKGIALDEDRYRWMLHLYYERRGWSDIGIPRRSTMMRLGLSSEVDLIGKIVKIED
ncbi:MAG: aldehyde ferredoxin oxidoreductase family protein [Nitrososphaerota archaeon]|nr:aldehyde ferredoxin oxidoreductase family protein [Nitrososphaerota archaeon]